MAGNVRFTLDGHPTLLAMGAGDGVLGLAFDPAGNLYEGDNGGRIYKTTAAGVSAQFSSNLVTGINQPEALAVDASGALYVAGRGINSGSIVKLSADGTSVTVVASGMGDLRGMTFDALGNLFVSDIDVGTVFKITPEGTRTVFASNIAIPVGLDFDSAGHLFVAAAGADQVLRISPDGATRSTYAWNMSGPYQLAVDMADRLLVGLPTYGRPAVVQQGEGNFEVIIVPEIYPNDRVAASTVPEPTLAALLVGGLVVMAGRRWRKYPRGSAMA